MSARVAIVGAGIGGLSTSILLARAGYDVTVYEKNSFIGGRCGQVIHEGHRFDLGATIYFLPSIYRDVFQSLEMDVESLDLIPVTTLYRLFFDDDSSFDVSTNEMAMRQQLEAREPGSFDRFVRYVQKGYKFLQIGIEKLLDRNFYHLFEFINLRNIVNVLKIKVHRRHAPYARRFFRHPHHRMAFTFQNIYVGQSPYNSSALFSMLPAAEITEGSMFPRGGMARIARELHASAEQMGVTIHTNREVSRIRVSGNRARGLKFSDGSTVDADLVVANADLPYVYGNLLPDRRAGKRKRQKTHTCSAIVFHWGVDKVYPQLSQHNVFLVDEYKKALDNIFKHHTMSEQPCFYVHAPSRTDPSAAPEGHDTLSVVVPVPHLDNRVHPVWETMRDDARHAVLRRLGQLGITDLEEHITFESVFMPSTWESVINVSKGATFGSLSHRILQMGYFRPHNRHCRYRNLYFAGGSTHPGNGIPLVLLSARLTAERIIRDQESHGARRWSQPGLTRSSTESTLTR